MKLLALTFSLLMAFYAQSKESFSTYPKVDKIAQCIANWVVQSETSGMTVISNSVPPLDKWSEALEIKNGDFIEKGNGWPTGGWCIPDVYESNRFIYNYIYSFQKLPQPSEIAFKMGITLGEFDYIFNKQKKTKSVWSDPSIIPSLVCLLDDSGNAKIKNYLHINGKDSVLIKSPDFEVKPGKPHLLSLWVRSMFGNFKPNMIFWYDAGLEDINVGYNSLPNTNGEWKRVSLYFRVPSDMRKGHFTFNFHGIKKDFIDVADFKLQTATEDEFTEAYRIERAKKPYYKISSNQEHGKYLATSIAKLERKIGLPDKPFLIWGVGSSWTNSLDDLEPIRQAIRAKFPNCPEIIYRKRCGSGTPYDFARGWVHTDVLAEQPDLIISYTDGSVTALEQMLIDIRQHSTADIIIPSLHFFQTEQLTSKYINLPIYEEIKKLCEKYKAQYVDNRRELAEWLITNNMPISSLLSDVVHQNALGKQLICENIAAHFCHNSNYGYEANSLEKRFYLKELAGKNSNEFIANSWEKKNNNIQTAKKGASIRFNFIGNRIDLIGVKVQNGGKLNVLIDDLPVEKATAFNISYIKPAFTNITHGGTIQYSSKGNADTGPHGISLGENVVPQKWIIKMIDNDGNYELSGSISGSDGKGNSNTMFKSKSGQIIIDPALWRANKANVKGDNWTFTVSFASTPVVDFNASSNSQELFSVTLTQNLTNEQHSLELINEGNGIVEINSFYVFNPILKEIKK